MLPPLRIGQHVSETPVVLAPMAGVTNTAFRRLCREQGDGFFVAEMVTSRALVERNDVSLRIVSLKTTNNHDLPKSTGSIQQQLVLQ